MTRSPLQCCTIIIRSSALVQASSSLSTGRTCACPRRLPETEIRFRHFSRSSSSSLLLTLKIATRQKGCQEYYPRLRCRNLPEAPEPPPPPPPPPPKPTPSPPLPPQPKTLPPKLNKFIIKTNTNAQRMSFLSYVQVRAHLGKIVGAGQGQQDPSRPQFTLKRYDFDVLRQKSKYWRQNSYIWCQNVSLNSNISDTEFKSNTNLYR